MYGARPPWGHRGGRLRRGCVGLTLATSSRRRSRPAGADFTTVIALAGAMGTAKPIASERRSIKRALQELEPEGLVVAVDEIGRTKLWAPSKRN